MRALPRDACAIDDAQWKLSNTEHRRDHQQKHTTLRSDKCRIIRHLFIAVAAAFTQCVKLRNAGVEETRENDDGERCTDGAVIRVQQSSRFT